MNKAQASESAAGFHARVGDETHRFDDLKTLMACASPRRSGDELAGLAASSEARRVAARYALADLPLKRFLEEPLVPYETDEVTRLIQDSHDATAFAPVASMTVGEFREWLLSWEADTTTLARLAPGLTPEMVAAVSKLCRNGDLIQIAAKTRVVTGFRSTIGLEGRLSARLQPNHPTDDPLAIAAATLDGLLFGMGDAVIGINPATDNVEACIRLFVMLDDLRQRFDIPTQSCVLSHVTTSIEAIERGAPLDLVFQSIAGTEAANQGFGVTLALLKEAQEAALSLKRGTVGQNVMYFETGQGAALSADAHHGVDQQTVEARAYAVARAFDPLLVNTVVGFIGPEYLYDAKEITRAGLEDHFCAKLLGVPMGCDVCYTNHAEADQDDMDNLALLLGAAGVTFMIGVPGADDIMLNYQSLSHHDIVRVRHLLGRRPAPEFEDWLVKMSLMDAAGRLPPLAPEAAPVARLLQGGTL
ncbi:ethanolamine ammonia-lyase [Xaviernesmea oryzae]|uniref:Ethanolamine ammonia-lyase large subunit n=1 Tax=Xaviernesmea oryzae TaxID=464029 RepID=A0A1Q9AQV7_9HYPH|nr:ethanolamine ammonia-lyase subunit EutB [Xaviernesmea oryzae]OLP57756.1 ethanolamine ammonia-lyase [Xaviernesmea oryzae]SEM06763.1 Ethanolamine ammonia-lyase heavy chain [Xaviernesmea oryzae]